MSDVRSYLMFLLLLPYSSGVWYCNTPLNCCWALPPTWMRFCGEWTDLGDTDHETAYMCLVL